MKIAEKNRFLKFVLYIRRSYLAAMSTPYASADSMVNVIRDSASSQRSGDPRSKPDMATFLTCIYFFFFMDPCAGHAFRARIHFRQRTSALLFIIAVACALSAKRRAEHVMHSACDQHTVLYLLVSGLFWITRLCTFSPNVFFERSVTSLVEHFNTMY